MKATLLIITDRPGASPPSLLVDEEESLRWPIIRGLNAHGESIEADVRTVGDEVTSIETGVPVTEAVQGDVLVGLVPLGDGLVDRDGQTSYSTSVAQVVTVVEADDLTIHSHKRVIRTGDDELDPLVPGEVVGEHMVQEILQRVPSLSGVASLLGGSGMVPRVAGDDQIKLGVVQEKLDTRSQDLLSLDDGQSRFDFCCFHHFFVDVACDEISQESEDHGRDLDVFAEDLSQT